MGGWHGNGVRLIPSHQVEREVCLIPKHIQEAKEIKEIRPCVDVCLMQCGSQQLILKCTVAKAEKIECDRSKNERE